MTSLVSPKTCSRCKGTGFAGNGGHRRTHCGIPSLCFKCDGAGQVESDRATLAARKAAHEAAEARWTIALTFFAAQPRNVREGFNLLEALEPARAAQALVSIEAGHPRVAAALLAYFTPENWARLEAKHGR